MNPQELLSLSRFAYVRRVGGSLVLESPIATAKVELRDPASVAWLQALARGTTLAELTADASADETAAAVMTIDLLRTAGLLTNERDDQFAQWEFADLCFHGATRTPPPGQPVGATYRTADHTAPPPAVAQWRGGERVPLPKPEPLPDVPFQSVLDARRSIRDHGAKPMSIGELSTFLHHSAAIRESGVDRSAPHEYEVTRRAYPSAGAAYPIDLYLLAHRCDGLDTGVYRYDAAQHALERIDASWDVADALFRSTTADRYASAGWNVMFVMGARFARLSWKYESIAYALLLAEAGSLMQTMYLVATAMDLSPCALGTSDGRLFAELIGSASAEYVSVGEFLLGSKVP